MASGSDLLVTGFGLIGQGLFSGRFLAQWYASEKAGRSVVPDIFWYLSLGGGLVLFIYACIRRDPVFIIGQGAGLFIYGRNLHFLRRARHAGREPELADPDS